MMNRKKTPEEYASIWKSHVSQLTRLGWNLPDKADREAIKDIQKKLNEIIEKATKNHD